MDSCFFHRLPPPYVSLSLPRPKKKRKHKTKTKTDHTPPPSSPNEKQNKRKKQEQFHHPSPTNPKQPPNEAPASGQALSLHSTSLPAEGGPAAGSCSVQKGARPFCRDHDVHVSSGVLKVRKWVCFPLTQLLRGDFDRGKITRPVLGTLTKRGPTEPQKLTFALDLDVKGQPFWNLDQKMVAKKTGELQKVMSGRFAKRQAKARIAFNQLGVSFLGTSPPPQKKKERKEGPS